VRTDPGLGCVIDVSVKRTIVNPLTNAASPERAAWLDRLSKVLPSLEHRWSLTPDIPLNGEQPTCSYVAAVRTANGAAAVLKIGMPHMEAEHEIDGLRFWDGDPAVRLLEADAALNAMLLERCRPGTSLRALPEQEQDVILAGLLGRLWRQPPQPHPFRPLAALTAYWANETLSQNRQGADEGLVNAGLQLFEELPRTAARTVLLATDLHAGNVVRAEREPWLVIDPKPFVGDPAYDATQHLFNCPARLSSDPHETIREFAGLAGLDPERVRLWLFARAAAEPRDDWRNDGLVSLARSLAP
jgi:streptomycin 6-kinase